MQQDMTKGLITAGLVRFAVPLMIGNLLQQFYNIADTWIVGRFLGADALAAGRERQELWESIVFDIRPDWK